MPVLTKLARDTWGETCVRQRTLARKNENADILPRTGVGHPAVDAKHDSTDMGVGLFV